MTSRTPWGCRPANSDDPHAVVFRAGNLIFHQLTVTDLAVIRAAAHAAGHGDDLTAWAVRCLTAGALADPCTPDKTPPETGSRR